MKSPSAYGSQNEETNFIRRVATSDRTNANRRQTKRLVMAGAALTLIGASAGVGYATLQAGQVDATATLTNQQMAASVEVPDFVEITSDTACVKKAMVPKKKRSLTFDKKTIDSLYYMLEVYCFETPIEIPQKYMQMFPGTQAPVTPPEPSLPAVPTPTTVDDISKTLVIDTPEGPEIVTPVGPVIDDKQVVTITTADGSKSTTTVDVVKTTDGNTQLEIPTGPGGDTTTVTVPSTSTTGSSSNGFPTAPQTSIQAPQPPQLSVYTPDGPLFVMFNGPVTDTKVTVTLTHPDGRVTTDELDRIPTSDGSVYVRVPTGPGDHTTVVAMPSPPPVTNSNSNGFPTVPQTSIQAPPPQVQVGTPEGPEIVTPVGPAVDDKQVVTITTADGSKSTTTVDVMKTTDGKTQLEIPTGPGGDTTTVTVPSTSTTGSSSNGFPTVPQTSIQAPPSFSGPGGAAEPLQLAVRTPEGTVFLLFVGPITDGKEKVTLIKPDGIKTSLLLEVTKNFLGRYTVEVPIGPRYKPITALVPQSLIPADFPVTPQSSYQAPQPEQVTVDTPEGLLTLIFNGPAVDGKVSVVRINRNRTTTTLTLFVTRTADGEDTVEVPKETGDQTTTVTVPDWPGRMANPWVPQISIQAPPPQVQVDTPEGPEIVTPVGPVIDDKQVVTITTADGSKSTTTVDVVKTTNGNNALEIPTGSGGGTTSVILPSTPSTTEGSGGQTTRDILNQLTGNGIDNGDKDFMSKDEFQLQIGSHFSEKILALKERAHDEEAESEKSLRQQQQLQDCIIQATNKFGYYGVYEQPPHFQNAVDWVDNECMNQ